MSATAGSVPPTPIAMGVGPIPPEWRSFFTLLLSRTGGSSGGNLISGSITSAQISDATGVGREVLTAADASLARQAIGAGTSSLTIAGVVSSLSGGTVQGGYNAASGTWSLTLDSTGVAPGTYNAVTVGEDGRVTGGSPASDTLDYATALAFGL